MAMPMGLGRDGSRMVNYGIEEVLKFMEDTKRVIEPVHGLLGMKMANCDVKESSATAADTLKELKLRDHGFSIGKTDVSRPKEPTPLMGFSSGEKFMMSRENR